MSPTHSSQPQPERPPLRVPTWLAVTAPLVLLGLVLWALSALQPIERIRGPGFPPIEELTVMRAVLPRPGLIELHVVNGGPDPVTVAQVLVDEAYWSHWMDAGQGATNDPALKSLSPERRTQELQRRRTVSPLAHARIFLEYPWVEGEAHELTLISQSGVTFTSDIEVAVESPAPTAGYFGLFALLGVLVGVIPVYLGLLWYPAIRRLGERGINILLAFTVGLLAFLAVDALAEAVKQSARLPESYEGPAMIVAGLVGSLLLLVAAGGWLRERAARREPAARSLVLAYMIALGIGLHNLGEGLAIGAAFNLGAVSLGTALIMGFTVHNITEGLAIVAPLARTRVVWSHLIWLGLLAGGPTVLGGWLGAFIYSPVWAVLALAIGTGAILQVVYEILRQMAAGRSWREAFAPVGNLAGLVSGYAFMYATGFLLTV